jgi:hypothetical protein
VAKKRNKLIRQRLVSGLDPETRAAILNGDPVQHPARWLALWREHRDELLADWIAERPGSRPPVWWQVEAPEPRRQLSGRGVVVSERYRNLDAPLAHGVPLFFEIDLDDPPSFESEASYLGRLNLLVTGESRWLPTD